MSSLSQCFDAALGYETCLPATCRHCKTLPWSNTFARLKIQHILFSHCGITVQKLKRKVTTINPLLSAVHDIFPKVKCLLLIIDILNKIIDLRYNRYYIYIYIYISLKAAQIKYGSASTADIQLRVAEGCSYLNYFTRNILYLRTFLRIDCCY